MSSSAKKKRSEASPVTDMGDLFDQVSDFADQCFEKIDQGTTNQPVKGITGQDFYQTLDQSLKKIKVFAFLAAPVLCLAALSNWRSSPLRCLFFAIIAADSFRISFNCYTKRYVAMAFKRFGGDGDPTKLGKTFLMWAKNTLGFGNGSDSLSQFSKGILWDLVFDGTVSWVATQRVRTLSSFARHHKEITKDSFSCDRWWKYCASSFTFEC